MTRQSRLALQSAADGCAEEVRRVNEATKRTLSPVAVGVLANAGRLGSPALICCASGVSELRSAS